MTIGLVLPVFLIVILALAVNNKTFCFIMFFLLLMFSNVFIAYISPNLNSRLELTVYQGLDFLYLVVLIIKNVLVIQRNWLTYVFGGRFDTLQIPYLICIGIICLFLFVGILINGFTASAIYLRMFVYPFCLIFFAAWCSTDINPNKFEYIFLVFCVVFAVLVFVERFFPYEYYSFINAANYYYIKSQSAMDVLAVDQLFEQKHKRLLNLNIFEDIQLHKVGGPTFNYPSSSYILLFGFMVSLFNGMRIISFFLLLAMAVLLTKASLVCLIFIFFGQLLYLLNTKAFNYLRLLFGTIYITCTLFYLYSLKELHSYSLISSVINVFSYPLGKGLGFGGSITAERNYTWEFNMLIGESGLAIILNMMGFVGLYVLYFYARFLRTSIVSSYAFNKKLFIYTMVGYACFCNCFMQELAIGPYGIGLALFFIILETKKHEMLYDSPVR